MTLSKENAEKIVWGGIYTTSPRRLSDYEHINPDNCWEQRYQYWIPVCVPKEDGPTYYMVNCYQINSGGRYDSNPEKRFRNTVSKMAEDYKADGSDVIRHTYDYYYRSGTILSDANFNLFTLVADLNDYRYINRRDSFDYLEGDVLDGVMLYREHAYPNGICVVRKDAEKNYARMIDAAIEEEMKWAKAPSVMPGSTDRVSRLVEKAEKAGAEFNVKKARAFMTYMSELEALQKKFAPIIEWYNKIQFEETENAE